MSESEKSSGESQSSDEASSELPSEEASSIWSSMGESNESSGYSDESSGNSDESSDSPSSSGQSCDEFDWVFTEVGDPYPWDGSALGRVIFRVRASGTGERYGNGDLLYGDCGGMNNNRQSGTAIATCTVPPGKILTMDWKIWAVVEAQDAGFDAAYLRVDDVLKVEIKSHGDDSGCAAYAPDPSTGSEIFAAGEHTIEVGYDTVDNFFHTDEFGVEFLVENCCITDAP